MKLSINSLTHTTAIKITIIFVLLIFYFLIGLFFNQIFKTDVMHTHFAYLPIVLAGIWWGRKSIIVAIILSLFLLLFQLIVTDYKHSLLSDVFSSTFFIVIATIVGVMSERIVIGRKKLYRSEENYRTIIQKSLSGIFIYKNDHIIFANEQFIKMMDSTEANILNKSIWDIIYSEDQPKVKGLLEKRYKGEVTDLHYEVRFQKISGELIWVDLLSSPIKYEKEPSVIVNIYDVTAKKQAEEKEQELFDLTVKQEEQLVHSTRLAELGEMAAGVAHELNQPLSGIRNFAKNTFYMLENKLGTEEEVKSNLQMITDQVDRAARIINQMRELARKTDHQFVPLQINTIIQEAIEFLSSQFRLSSIEIQLNLEEQLPEVKGDRIRLEQVFLNILTNARQAMEETDKRTLKVETKYEKERELPVQIIIMDSGKGFSPENKDNIFKPFYSTKKTGQGTGLGLSISHSIIQDHKGKIEATGQINKGAVFTISFPIIEKEGTD